MTEADSKCCFLLGGLHEFLLFVFYSSKHDYTVCIYSQTEVIRWCLPNTGESGEGRRVEDMMGEIGC